MTISPQDKNEFADIEEVAALWAIRIDRGLTAQEQDEYTDWLTQSPQHRKAMRLFQWSWDELDRLAGLQTSHHARPDPDLLAPGNRYARQSRMGKLLKFTLFALPTSIAALFAIAFFLQPERGKTPPTPTQIAAPTFPARIERHTLPDGSKIAINRGGKIQTRFAENERHVELLQGEATFTVAKDPSRPFIVTAAGKSVRAVGTEFNVKLGHDQLDVIVTEGVVSLQETQLLTLNQQALVTLDTPLPETTIATLDATQIETALSWQPKLLDFDAAPLSQIVAAFNRCNADTIQIVLGNAALGQIELSCAFWSDNTEGFVRLMESSFDMQAEWLSSREILLK